MTGCTRLLAAAVTMTVLAGPVTAAAEPTCVAIALPSVQGAEGSATDVGNALRDLLTSYLTGPSMQPVPLEARLASQAIEEARQKPCDYILLTTLTRTRKGGGALGQALGHAAGTAAWHIPGGSGTGSAIARSAAAGGAAAVAATAASTRARDELRLEFRLSSPDTAASAPSRTERAKAKVDGEDLLTPLVERVAQAVVERVRQ